MKFDPHIATLDLPSWIGPLLQQIGIIPIISAIIAFLVWAISYPVTYGVKKKYEASVADGEKKLRDLEAREEEILNKLTERNREYIKDLEHRVDVLSQKLPRLTKLNHIMKAALSSNGVVVVIPPDLMDLDIE